MNVRYVLGYDIADPKRLRKVYRRMINHATPLQYSVFYLSGSESDLQKCLKETLDIMNSKEDDLRIYKLPARGVRLRLGQSKLPEGIFFTEMEGLQDSISGANRVLYLD